MKRFLLLLVGIVLVASVILFEEQHRAATVKHQVVNLIPSPEMEAPRLESPPVVRENNFADYADLWGNPWIKNPDPDTVYSSLAFQRDLAPASSDKVLAKSGIKTEPVLTVQDREAAYAIFSSGGFRLTFNLKPAYASPTAILPNHLDPSIGGSFSF